MSRRRTKLPVDPISSAKAAGLLYVDSASHGFTRRRAGKGFRYLDTRGHPLRDPAHLERIRALVIPPAWTNVWICALPNGHLQAVGYDARGRRQYRYHPRYREIRDETKFARMTQFAADLPCIRHQVNRDLGLSGLPRPKVLASVVRLLETTFIRVGNIEYARDNDSFGLTTLRNRHVDIEGSTVRFTFRGKSGLRHQVEIRDPRLARVIKACHDLPGYNLFEYVDDDGKRHNITSGDVNSYLHSITGKDYTAKDFRTWAGTVQTALGLAAIGAFESATEARHNIVAVIKDTAKRLGNRPATCRNYYVHPLITQAYLDGTLLDVIKPPREDLPANGATSGEKLHPEELCVLRLLEMPATPKRKVA